MGSIPLPALHVDPPQPPQNPLDSAARLIQLRNAMQNAPVQQQILQQQAQGGALQLQQTQREMDSQNAIMQAYSDSQGDLSKTLAAASKSGKAIPSDLIKLQQAALQQKSQALDLLSKQGNLAIQQADMMSGAADAVTKAPAEQKAAVYQQQLQNLGSQGIDVSKLPPQYPGDQAFNTINLGVQSHKTALDNASKEASIGEQTAKTNLENTQQQVAAQGLMYGPSGPAAEAKYRFILQKKAAGAALSPDEVNFARGYEASQAKSTNTSDSLGIVSSNLSKPAGLASVGQRPMTASGLPSGVNSGAAAATSPQTVKNNIVDEIGQYKMDPALMGRALYKHPELLGAINSKYPDWDQTQYQAKNKIAQSYTSGPESKSINAIGTALGHANELRDAIDALGNGNNGLQTLRSLGNKVGVEVGQDPVTAFNTIVHRLAPEITAAYVQGGGGEGERAAAANDFSPSLSRQQLLGNWSETVKLLQSKIAQQQQQWDTTFRPTRDSDQFANRFLSAPAKQAIQRWSGETGGQSALASAPKEGDIKTNSAGDKIKFTGGKWTLQ